MYDVIGWRKKGKLVGVAVIRLGTSRWHLCYYCIDEAHRGKGIGSKFLRKIVKRADNKTLTLEANASLRNFYRRFGFNTFGFDDEFYWMYKSHKRCSIGMSQPRHPIRDGGRISSVRTECCLA